LGSADFEQNRQPGRGAVPAAVVQLADIVASGAAAATRREAMLARLGVCAGGVRITQTGHALTRQTVDVGAAHSP
jgi:hypothetical protein